MIPVPLPVPWLEAAILVAAAGAVCVSPVRDPARAWRWGLAFTAVAGVCALLSCVGFYLCRAADLDAGWGLGLAVFGQSALRVDDLSAPLIAVVGLLHFLTALATGRTKMRRFSIAWSLASEAIRLAIFGCTEPWVLVVLLIACVVPPYFELRNRGRPARVYVLHMALFAGLLVSGWALTEAHFGLGPALLLVAVLIRSGAVPAHCWLTDWFEHASLGTAVLFVTPLPGVYAAVRLVLPIAPAWVLGSLGMVSLATAVYAAGMAAVQRDARRFFAYLFLSHASLVLVGLQLTTATSLTGALALWVSAALSLGGFGLTLRALEARFGRLSLADHSGLYDHSSALAACFLLTGLATVGFPGTLGFVASELLVDGAVEASLTVGVAVALAAAVNGIAVVRAYLRLFTGARPASAVALGVGARERAAVLTLAALILGGGLVPQPGVASRYRAATAVLKERADRRDG